MAYYLSQDQITKENVENVKEQAENNHVERKDSAVTERTAASTDGSDSKALQSEDSTAVAAPHPSKYSDKLVDLSNRAPEKRRKITIKFAPGVKRPKLFTVPPPSRSPAPRNIKPLSPSPPHSSQGRPSVTFADPIAEYRELPSYTATGDFIPIGGPKSSTSSSSDAPVLKSILKAARGSNKRARSEERSPSLEDSPSRLESDRLQSEPATPERSSH